MKKLSRLTALLLALVLMMTTSFSAVADSDIFTWEGYSEAARDALRDAIMGAETYAEYWEIVKDIDEADFEEFYAALTEEEQKAMAEYVEGMFWDSCVSYTDAAPFLSAVDVSEPSVSTYSLMMLSDDYAISTADETEAENGLILDKTATFKEKGTYTIRLEAYVTGNITTETVTTSTPCDIVLVLDMSKSMSSSFGSTTRIAALKTAVKNFITATAGKYDATTADHRICIVGYNSAATVNAGWTYVDAAGSTSLQNTVTNMGQSTGTNTHLGLATANIQLTTNYSYTGSNTNRQKVVILFTDGVPGTSSGNFSESAAATAITNAKTIKDGGASVYSVAIYSGANPATAVSTTPSGDTNKINAMLHAISSNYPNATASSSGETLTVNYGTGGNNGYYLTASDPDDLNNIFQEISSSIQTGSSSMALGSSTVVKDIVAPTFNMPKNVNASTITVQTVECTGYTNGAPTWATEAETLSDATISAGDDNSINVSGFDFANNFVSENGYAEGNPNGTGNYHGKKLVISFDITVKQGFLGGNDIPTNGTESAIYSDGTKIEAFNVPVVDIEVKAPVVDVNDKNVYLCDSLTQEELLSDATVTVYDVYGKDYPLELDKENYGLDAYQTEYVELSVDKTGAAAMDNLTADTTFSLACTLTPTGVTGTPVKDTANVNVFKPVLTFNDSEVDYKKALDLPSYYNTTNYKNRVAWMHGETKATITTMGDAPELALTYTTSTEDIDENNVVISKDDIPVQVTVAIGETPVTEYTTFAHEDCSFTDCTWDDEAELNGNPAFLLHVVNIYGNLAITKNVVNETEVAGATSFEFTVTLTDAEGNALTEEFTYKIGETSGTITSGGKITLSNRQTATIEELPPETKYTVAETVPTGYESTVVKTDNDTDGEIDPGMTDSIVFTNTFKVGSLTIKKEITGGDTNTEDDVFTFNVTIGGVTTKHTITGAGSVTIPNIPINTEYSVEEINLPTGYELNSSANASGKIVENGNTATFTNAYETGKLIVSKTVVGKDADLTKKFAFTVTLTDLAEKQLTGTYGGLAFVNGVASFKLAHDESREFIDIPKGAEYTVVETADAAYTTTMSGDTGNIADVAAEAKFTNTYKYGSLEISKTVVNTTGTTPLSDEFTFEVALSKDGNYAYTSTIGETTTTGTLTVVEGKGTLTIKGGETVVISGIETGTTYTVTETGIPTGYELTSKTGDTGTIVVDVHSSAAFTNTYTAAGLTISKTVVGTDAPKGEAADAFTFTVTLTGKNGEALTGTYGDVAFANGTATITLKHGASKILTGIPTGASYTVVETEHADYTTTVNGTANRTANGTIDADGETVAYENTYKYGSLTITKAFNGCTPQAGETFLFKVTGPNEFAMDVVIAGAGSATIEHLPLGTYTVTEDNAWSWRYTSNPASASDEITATENGSVTFTNSLSENKWLDGNAYAENNFSGVNPNPTANSDAE